VYLRNVQSDLDIVVSPHHRARVTVRRILRADEVATALRDVIIRMNGDREPVCVAPWGDILVETSRRVDVALDTYPLGALAYQMLTGNPPQGQVFFVPGAPPQLATLIMRMLSPDRRARPNILEVKETVKVLIGATDASVVQELPRAASVADEPLDLGIDDDDELLTLE